MFDSNIGTIGGAIYIDIASSLNAFPDDLIYSPYVLIKNNTFSRNMAYFEGNAVYIQGGYDHF